MSWKTTRDGIGTLSIAGAIALLTCTPTHRAPADTPKQPASQSAVPTVVVDAQGSSKVEVGVPAMLVVPAGEKVEAVMNIAATEVQQYLSNPTLVYRISLVGVCENLKCKPCIPPDPNQPSDPNQPDCTNFPPPPPSPRIDGLFQDGYMFMRTQ